MSFVHLHTHSEYSLLDGATRIPELVAHVKRLGMDSLAVTDHGNMHAAWSFYEAAKAQNIRPVLGFEAYLAGLEDVDARRQNVAELHRRKVNGRERDVSRDLTYNFFNSVDLQRLDFPLVNLNDAGVP